MERLLFGTAGVPISSPKGTILDGISHLSKLGLDGMELEFVRSVNVKPENAPAIKKIASDEGKILTCHGQYFINLNSLEQEKVVASKERILKAARVANLCGAWSMTFHAAFYQSVEKAKVYDNVKDRLNEIIEILKSEGNKIWVRPETTGKESQFGNIKEILSLSQELDQVMPCIDFSHLHARSGGKFNTLAEFRDVLEQVEKALGRKGLENMHIHVSGIEYTEKGERNHLNLKDSDLNYLELIEAWKEFKIKGIVICESPNIEEDALLMKKAYA